MRLRALSVVASAACLLWPPLASAAAAATSLRYDGLYCRRETGDFSDLTAYLRFYRDGTVLYVVCNTPPAKVAKWFYRGYVPEPGLDLAQGRYTVEGQRIRFSTRATEEPRIDFSGHIEPQSLQLRTVSHYNGRRAKVRFDFVPVRFSR